MAIILQVTISSAYSWNKFLTEVCFWCYNWQIAIIGSGIGLVLGRWQANWKQMIGYIGAHMHHQGSVLITWINVNPGMDNSLQPL